MIENDYYPIGANNEFAPWNQEDNPEKEIEVTVSITLSKTIKIKVSDYKIIDSGKDEDNEYFEDVDYSVCALRDAVEDQIVLPQNGWMHISPKSNTAKKAISDLKGWNIDEFEVIEE